MQERLVEACLMRGRPARADSTLALRGLQAGWCSEHFQKKFENGGAEGIRTPDPKTASLVLSQLSYSPTRMTTLQGTAEGCQGYGKRRDRQGRQGWYRGRDSNPHALAGSGF